MGSADRDGLARALALAARGDGGGAVALLEGLPSDPRALVALALWRVEGRLTAPDLARARREAEAAAALGLGQAARLLAALRACGAGGERDWAGALDALRADPASADELALIAAMDIDDAGDPCVPPPARQLHADPAIHRIDALLTPGECAFLIGRAAPRLRPATIFHEGEGRFVRDPIRRSDAAGFPLALETPAIHALNRRIAAASGTAPAQGEPLQVLRYGPGDAYRPHLDAVPGLANQRALTMLVWLDEDYAGGETAFDTLGLALRGRPGDALLFRNVDAIGRPDRRTIHAGRPVTRGVKHLASRWIRARPPHADESFGAHEAASGR